MAKLKPDFQPQFDDSDEEHKQWVMQIIAAKAKRQAMALWQQPAEPVRESTPHFSSTEWR